MFSILMKSQAQELSLKEALSGWKKHKYHVDAGVITRNGDLNIPGKLSCSGFFSVIYHRMKFGEKKWLREIDFTVQAVYGDEAAKKLGLKKLGSKTLFEWGKSKPADGLYFFNTRKGKAGHVGFIEIKNGQPWIQHHYSELKKYNGYAGGLFSTWYLNSKYRKSAIELYPITF